MSLNERKILLTLSFKELWNYVWGDIIAQQYRSEEKSSNEKLDLLKKGVIVNNEYFNLESLLNECSEEYIEPEWGFPKGRRNFQEKDIMCGIREFEEETGYVKQDISFIDNIIPFEEIYTGTNLKSYKHKYFLAYTDKTSDDLHNYQQTEVSKLDWKTLEECLESIRPYNLEKKQLIININKVLQEYRLY